MRSSVMFVWSCTLVIASAAHAAPSELGLDVYVDTGALRGDVQGKNRLDAFLREGWRIVRISDHAEPVNDRVVVTVRKTSPQASCALLDVINDGHVRGVRGSSTAAPAGAQTLNDWTGSGWAEVARMRWGRIRDRFMVALCQ